MDIAAREWEWLCLDETTQGSAMETLPPVSNIG